MTFVKKHRNAILSIGIIAVIFVFVLFPAKYAASFLQGLQLWVMNVVPTLFPFFVLSALLIRLGWVTKCERTLRPALRFLFRAPPCGGYVFLLSVLSGYPVGAKLIQTLHRDGKLSRTQCLKLTTFCSTSGPLFLLGTVGAGFFRSSLCGWLLFGSHLAAALLNGLLYRNRFLDDAPTVLNDNRRETLNDILFSSVVSILCVGACIALFYLLADVLLSRMPFSQPVLSVLHGLLEVTRGCSEISAAFPVRTALILSSFTISFGGGCILLQSFAYLADCGIKFTQLLEIKLTHALLSAGCTSLLLLLVPAF